MTGTDTGAAAGTEADRLYVYAVVPAGVVLPELRGIEGRPVTTVGGPDGPQAVVHEHRGGPYQGDDEAAKTWVLEHSDVIDAVWQTAGTVLPMTFNVIVDAVDAGEAEDAARGAGKALREWLSASGDELTAQLEGLRGLVELKVEVSLDVAVLLADDPELLALEQEAEAKPPGIRRLLRKRLTARRRELAEAIADERYPGMRARIARRCTDLLETGRPSADTARVVVLSAACLIPRDDVHALGEELSAVEQETPEASVRFLGPWPAYSFSGAGPTA